MELNELRKIAMLYPKDRVVDGETVLALVDQVEWLQRKNSVLADLGKASHEWNKKNRAEMTTRLEQAEKNSDTYQTLYEQRAESLEQAERALEATERQVVARSGETAAERIWRSRAEQAEQAVARVRSLCMTTDGDLICPDFDGNTVGDILRALDGDGRG